MNNRGSTKITLLIVLGVLVVLGIALVSWYVGIRNKLVELNEGTKTAWSNVENQLQRRFDLIPNLVETVKGYAGHEEKVLVEVTQARASVGGATTQSDKIAANNNLTSALGRLMVVVEKYPDLKANTNFLALQDELAGTENRISVERRRYNDAARQFNTIIQKIPYSFFAAGYEKAPYFEAAEGSKEAPKVKF
ncbi:MAG: LemA family protein [Candidatus Raymondbacteria bacterium RifOxyC12_full_50_8]|uniref:LemA family protein n=1 Tax=Candidatus Raymondbacteria bacterium RIFOXYD12_FULL_49_13 TaxID=1817890 RepID=A0A1F7F072_UNCRA|nr:MAG: LemA family protein [Candidatus Raymondbacteria bacterium RIFOXYA2_FULL_49_16]OGK00044.1 MAG: LemA family protein [Candidatus Raymondbacteria bacterium RIFOXYD12_FULL_49_13]OGK01334.1 MAG: LemA family protein [Candidatus Raymondbacteria bacterium RifOxyC12_full_50_8]OGK03661.1 MAG: LemA family protein [Candidatus Raymondbacteria bacterium RifOxyB12_full_50_8]OGP45033.1 MAG: LemA family protein [Candidatus Raymondbacteria bacterium RIFOXYB2_FULL_49_35]